MKTLRNSSFVAVCASTLLLSACATNRPTGTHEKQIEHQAVVTVEAIDVANRLVSVRTPANEFLTVYVDPSHKEFPMASVGDKVRVRYVESIAVRLAKPGEIPTGVQYTEGTTEPAKGRPSASAASELSTTVRIEAVNSNGSVVTFTGPRGKRAIAVKDPAMRDFARQLRPGDNVDVTYKEAIALSLEKVKL